MRRQCCQNWIGFHVAICFLLTDLRGESPPAMPFALPLRLNITGLEGLFNYTFTKCQNNTTPSSKLTFSDERGKPAQLTIRNKPSTGFTTSPRWNHSLAMDDPSGSFNLVNPTFTSKTPKSQSASLFRSSNDIRKVSVSENSSKKQEQKNPSKSSASNGTSVLPSPSLKKALKLTGYPLDLSSADLSKTTATVTIPLGTTTALLVHHFFLMTFNGSCDTIESSQEHAQGFVSAFERSLADLFDGLTESQVYVYQISCGSVIVNFSLLWDQAADFRFISERILHDNFSVLFARRIYTVISFTQQTASDKNISNMIDHQMLAKLEFGPATGHVYQGFIYIVVGAIVGVLMLIVATVFIVRLHRRKGQTFAVSNSGDGTPVKFDNVNDYTLTRIPRTTKLYLDDIERNPWAYSNPDFHSSLSSIVAPGEKIDYLNFVNSGVIPMLNRSSDSSLTNNPLLSVSVGNSSSLDGDKGEFVQNKKKNAKEMKQSFADSNDAPAKLKACIKNRKEDSSEDSQVTAVRITTSAGWDTSHI